MHRLRRSFAFELGSSRWPTAFPGAADPRLHRQALAVATAAIYVALCLVLTAASLRLGNPLLLAAACALPLIPFAFIAVLRAPLLIPFSLYAAFVPFENLSDSGPLGSAAKLLAIVSVCALVIHVLLVKSFRLPGRSVAVWGGWIVYMAASLTWSIDAPVSIDFFTRYAQLYLLLVAVSITPTDGKSLRGVLIAAIAGATCAAVYGDYLFLHAMDLTGDHRVFMQAGDNRIDPNHFAAALLAPFAIALMTFLRLRVGFAKLGVLCVVVTIGTGFLTAASRGALLAIGVMLVYFAIRSRYRLTLGGIAAAAAIVVAGSSLTERFAIALRTGGAGRTFVWRTAYAAFQKAWLFGSGTGSFQDAYDRAWLEVNHGTFPEWHMVAHNLFAQTSVELGVVGVGIVLFAWYSQFRSLHDTSGSSAYVDLRIAIEGATLALFAASFFLDIMWYKYTWEAFIFAALARNYARPARERDATASVSPQCPSPLRQ